MKRDEFISPGPWRIGTVSSRRSDEQSDILEAEFLHDDRVSRRHGGVDMGDRDIRHSYDESQALEVLSVEPGWMHGERFYQPQPPKFEDEECYIQDFGFGPYLKKVLDIFWRSMTDDVPEIPKNLSDVLSPDFFLPGHKKSV